MLNFPWGEFKCPKGGGKRGVGVGGECKKITVFQKVHSINKNMMCVGGKQRYSFFFSLKDLLVY